MRIDSALSLSLTTAATKSELRKSTGILLTSEIIRIVKFFFSLFSEDSCRSANKLSATIYELKAIPWGVTDFLYTIFTLYPSPVVVVVFVILANKLIKLTFINTGWASHTCSAATPKDINFPIKISKEA